MDIDILRDKCVHTHVLMGEHSATLPPPQKKNISKRTSRN